MKVIDIKSKRARVRKIRSLIKSVGNKIGSVHFIKRSDGFKRKMSYRLHVQHPTYAPFAKKGIKHFKRDMDNYQIIVFDTNKVRYNNKKRMCGRGDWRTIPLENVTRVAVNGEKYKIVMH